MVKVQTYEYIKHIEQYCIQFYYFFTIKKFLIKGTQWNIFQATKPFYLFFRDPVEYVQLTTPTNN